MKSMFWALGLLLAGLSPALAVDCGHPVAASDTAICNDSQLEALEITLGNALKVALDNSRAPDRDTLTANQAAWIDGRAGDCENGPGGAKATPTELRQCLLDDTNTRIKYLTGQPLEGPGAPDPMVPQLFAGKDQSFLTAMRFVDPKSPGEKLFNHLVYEQMKDLHLAQDENDITDAFTLTLQYASAALISANIDMAYLGPSYAHPMPYNYAINVDLAAAKELKIADALDAPAIQQIQQQCEAQLADLITPHEGGAQRKDDIDQMVADLSHWTFGAKQAVIADEDYFSNGPFSCTIGYDVLRPLLKAGFPLPN